MPDRGLSGRATVLESEDLLVRLDPAHGGEIADLIERRRGRQLLAHTPFATGSRLTGDVPEEVWIQQYRGGWQLLTPNAGSPSQLGGEYHGFHGAASSEPWSPIELAADSAVLEWEGHGMRVRRTIRVEAATVVLETTWRASAGRVPMVAVEHLALGPELLDPEFELDLPGGRLYELSETLGPTEPPADAGVWPFVRLLSGEQERADRCGFDSERSRFLSVAGLPEGRAEIRNPSAGLGFRLDWDLRTLPHAWIWHEVRTTGRIWRGAGQLLMIEPSSVPHSLGLEAAVRSGDAHVLEPGAPVTSRVRATILFLEDGDRRGT